ncbi:unnamed protein product [Rotaria sp. Silwood2]|nr:unnamed protein product [Rotaria sp. Silwood2]CAF3045859.1 unnamed protein product [Rotaria sp. Silwood2]CAF3199470.1 unnamed protein product [Rotaria sp. Silwood2]CAF3899006.1 unnamed protein product [Rotaria sp. Silwood2]CAF3923677.1 unnamed protein product [Rotaria sp. Silwood2]
MLSSREYRRSISIGLVLTSLTLITFVYVGSSTNNYYTVLQNFQFSRGKNLSHPSSVRVLCLILTTPKYILTRAKAVYETWAPQCDRYFFITESLGNNVTSKQSNFTEQIPIAPIKNITAGYDHLTQKSTLAFLFAYENYFNDFDWFVKADDDTYVIVENLKTFLSEQNTSEPVTFGYNFKVHVPKGYHSGGAAYVLSRESLRRFYGAHNDSTSNCRKDGGSEDVEIANCLRTKGVYPGKSVDKQNRELFHPLPFIDHFRGSFPDWLATYAENPPQGNYNCCSDQTISFHYVKPEEQYLMYFLLYKTRSTPHIDPTLMKTSHSSTIPVN